MVRRFNLTDEFLAMTYPDDYYKSVIEPAKLGKGPIPSKTEMLLKSQPFKAVTLPAREALNPGSVGAFRASGTPLASKVVGAGRFALGGPFGIAALAGQGIGYGFDALARATNTPEEYEAMKEAARVSGGTGYFDFTDEELGITSPTVAEQVVSDVNIPGGFISRAEAATANPDVVPSEVIGAAPQVFDINQLGDPALNPGSVNVMGIDPFGVNENLIDRGNPLGDPRVVSEELGLMGLGRNPMAQFDGSPLSASARQNLKNQRDTMRANIKAQSPSGIGSLISTIVGLASGIPVGLITKADAISKKGTELSRAFARGLGVPRRETIGMVYDDRGRGYTPAELNRMNAAGGYYSEPARQQRRRERRVEKMLERKAAGKSYSQKNLNRLTTGGSKPGTYTVKGAGSAGEGRGGKSIVCTAMYQTTGLQDWKKAMKIWYIYQKKHLTDTHQEGYHWLFKPFVKAMKKSKIVEALGAHVAKHRTQELKHILFNSKSDKLGKVYNMILEPICFIAGKIKSVLGRG